MPKIVRIGCGAGFWGDSPEGPKQLVQSGEIDYLILDYLAEITMSIMVRMKAKTPDAGYATDFVTMVMAPLAAEIARRKIRVVTNAGGLNPDACRTALQTVFEKAGVNLSIAIVHGDDLTARAAELQQKDVREMFSGQPLPKRLASINAYLGAFPIAKALDEGADIVLTGRCVDSALALGPLIHEFGWREDDYDLLAAGSLAGHIIECGPQTTGGIATDWRSVEGWDRMGYPIAACAADGAFDITKPAGTGGLLTPATVAEQVVYEIGDPAAYLLPDVVCDFSQVRLAETGPNRVRVTGATGRAPPGTYKVSATYSDGYRAVATMMIAGRDAVPKAEQVGAAILARASRLMTEAGFDGFDEMSIEILGAETNYGHNSRARGAREVVLKIGVRHRDRDALKIFAREIYPSASSMAQGITGFAGGRPEPQPVVRLFSFLVAKADVPVTVTIGDKNMPVAPFLPKQPASPAPAIAKSPESTSESGPRVEVPLIALAHGRSGDKGDIANIGILARDPAFVAVLRQHLTPEAVRTYLAHFAKGKVERYDWPGLNGFNFLLHEGLGGGGVASLRHDPQGKALAQILLDMPVPVPADWLKTGGLLADYDEARGATKDSEGVA